MDTHFTESDRLVKDHKCKSSVSPRSRNTDERALIDAKKSGTADAFIAFVSFYMINGDEGFFTVLRSRRRLRCPVLHCG